MSESAFYVTGGTLQPDAPSYVERAADRELHAALTAAEYCHILRPRQMGKSSLMIRAVARLRTEGIRTAILDLTALGQNLTPDQWYRGLAALLGDQLNLEEEVRACWREHAELGPLQRWMRVVDDVVLAAEETPLVIFVDEIDAVRSFPFSTDEFFAAIRECHNRRAGSPALRRLTFCLLGVASPADLIRDTRSTPFNIGRRIELTDFSESEAALLARGLGKGREALRRLRRVLFWTDGHPYLTQRLCQRVAANLHAAAASPAPGGASPEAAVDAACGELFFSRGARDRENNLLFVRQCLLGTDEDRAALLSLYRQILEPRGVRDDETNSIIEHLKLAGVARSARDRLRVRNRIYARVFNRGWVVEHMPDAELRRQKAAYRRGVLRGAALTSAVALVMACLTAAAVTQAEAARRLSGELRQQNLALEGVLRREKEERSRADSQTSRANQEAAAAREAQAGERRQRLAASQSASVARAERRAAERQRRVADRRREEADRQREAARRRQVRLSSAFGVRLQDEHDYFGSLLWFAEALRQDSGDPARAEAHRVRFGTTFRHSPRLRQILFHDAAISSVSFHPDGRRLLSASSDGTARLWDLRTGRETVRLSHKSWVSAATFSGNGSRIATAGGDRTARVWDTETGLQVTPPLPHPATVWSVQFSPDGGKIVTTSAEFGVAAGEARVWSAVTGEPLTPPLKHDAQMYSAEFSPDGARILTVTTRSARVYQVAGGTLLTEMQHAGSVDAGVGRFSPDGKHVLSGGQGGAYLWDAATGRRVIEERLTRNWAGPPAFSPDGKRVLITDRFGLARVCDVATGAAVTSTFKHDAFIRSAAYSPDGTVVITGSDDRTARVWTADRGDPVVSLRHGATVSSVAFSPDARYFATASDDSTVRIWDRLRPQRGIPPLFQRTPSDPVPDIKPRFRADGRLVTAAYRTLRTWDSSSGAPAGPPVRVAAPAMAEGALSPDGELLATVSNRGAARVWDARTGRAWGSPLSHPGTPIAPQLAPGGRLLATGSTDGAARVWEPRSGRELCSVKHTGLTGVRLSPDGAVLATTGGFRVALWDARTGKPLLAPIETGGYPGPLTPSFSRDGTRMATGGGVVAQVWDVRRRKRLRRLNLGSWVFSSQLLPEGDRLVTVTGDGAMRVWDVATGGALTAPMPHGARAWVTSPLSNRGWIATGTVRSEHRIWDTRTGEPLTPVLGGRHEGDRSHTAFSPDARSLVLESHQSGSPAEVWDLSPDPRPAEELVELAQVLSGHRLDASGGMHPLGREELLRLWNRVRARRPADFAPPEGGDRAWHLWMAEAAIHRRDGRDHREAIRQFSAALALDPDNAVLRARRGRCHYELNQWAAAVADCRKALELDPGMEGVKGLLAHALSELDRYYEAEAAASAAIAWSPASANAWNSRGIARWNLGKNLEALADFTRAIELDSKASVFWSNRGGVYADLGRFQEALADLSYVVDPGSGPVAPHEAAVAALALGDASSYRALTASLLQRHAGATDAATANTAAWTAALAPDAVADYGAALTLARRAVEASRRAYPALNTLGTLLYRAGEEDEAVRTLEAAIAAHGKGGTPADWLVLAMAEARRGNPAAARTWLSRAREWLDRVENVTPLSWSDRMELVLFRREAEQIVPPE